VVKQNRYETVSSSETDTGMRQDKTNPIQTFVIHVTASKVFPKVREHKTVAVRKQ
jgi:hypothetical protein